jgi:hypothetical protein
VASIDDILEKMRRNPKGIRFNELCSVCDHFFGKPRKSGTSHRVYKTPWAGDPRVNIQNSRGKAKAYQVRQVLLAVDRLENDDG